MWQKCRWDFAVGLSFQFLHSLNSWNDRANAWLGTDYCPPYHHIKYFISHSQMLCSFSQSHFCILTLLTAHKFYHFINHFHLYSIAMVLQNHFSFEIPYIFEYHYWPIGGLNILVYHFAILVEKQTMTNSHLVIYFRTSYSKFEAFITNFRFFKIYHKL